MFRRQEIKFPSLPTFVLFVVFSLVAVYFTSFDVLFLFSPVGSESKFCPCKMPYASPPTGGLGHQAVRLRAPLLGSDASSAGDEDDTRSATVAAVAAPLSLWARCCRRAPYYLPILGWGSSYTRAQVAGDTAAGLVAGIMMFSQSVSYASLFSVAAAGPARLVPYKPTALCVWGGGGVCRPPTQPRNPCSDFLC